MKARLIGLLAALFMLSNCSTSYQTPRSNPGRTATVKPKARKTLPAKVYYVDKNNAGVYEPIELREENEPIPKQGKSRWVRDFYGSIKYPPLARENGVSGIVILDVSVDQTGKVTSVSIKEGFSKDCEEEAKRAFLHSTQQGYPPLMINNVPTKFRMELPVGFWLE